MIIRSQSIRLLPALRSLIWGALLVCAVFAHYGRADSATLQLSNAYFRLPVAGRSTSAAYMQITNLSDTKVQLSDFSADLATSVELHEHRHVDGMMSMRKVANVTLNPGETLTLQPGGYHLMLFGLPAHLTETDVLTVQIGLESGDEVSVSVNAQTIR